MILSPKWQAALRWYLQWSEADLGGMRSSQAGTVAQLEMRANLGHHRRTDRLSGPLECHPTPSFTAVDHAVDEMLRRVESVPLERQVRAGMNAAGRELGEVLLLVHGVERMPARAAFGPWGNVADRTDAAAQALAREQTRAHRAHDARKLVGYLDRLSASAELPREQLLEVKRIALGCEQLAARAGAAFMRGVQMVPRRAG